MFRNPRCLGLGAMVAVTLLFMTVLAFSVEAQSSGDSGTKASSEGPYSGGFWTRSTLTGDWGGLRNDLAAKGVTVDLNLTQVYQGVTGGGKGDAWKYGGRGDLTFIVDTGKLGLWPGGFVSVEVEGNFGESVNNLSGALMPVNTNQMFPLPTGNNLNIPNVSLMQYFCSYAAVIVGKLATINPTSGDMNEFAHGKGDAQFMNTSLNFNPAMLMTVPYSTLGAGLLILPTKDISEAAVTVMAVQTNGQPNTAGFSDLHWNELSFIGEGRVRTDFFGLTGHQLIGGVYSNKTFTSLDQNRLIIETAGIEKKHGSWAVYYNFDQYLYETKKGSGRGIGIFGRFGAADGNPNPVRFFYSLGVGGKGLIPGREFDQFGVGGYYGDISNPKFTGPAGTLTFLRNAYGFEAYYNVAITPWLQLTPDIQIIRPGEKHYFDTSSGVPIRKNIDTTTLFGIRLKLVF